jgi:hypothetical protein
LYITLLHKDYLVKLASIALLRNLQRLEQERQAANMSELQFAKQFLTSVDAKNTKYQLDHVFDLKTFATRVPYTLPRLSHPPHPNPPKSTPSVPAAPGAAPIDAGQNLSITLKSTRNPNMSLRLEDLTSATTIQSLKEAVQIHLGGAGVVSIDKIKILLNKKPIPASKPTVRDAFTGTDVDGRTEVELAIMVMGGAPDPPVGAADVVKPATPVPGKDNATSQPPTQPDPMEGVEKTKHTSDSAPKSKEVLSGPQFWADLEQFLADKLDSQAEAQSLRQTFENAWRSITATP